MIAIFSMSLSDLLCWAIVLPALGVIGYRTLRHSEDRGALILKLICSAALLLVVFWILSWNTPFKTLFILPFCVIVGFIWTPVLGQFIARPLTSAFDGGGEEVEAKPFYFAAEGKRRQGLYEEAAAEVRKQLVMFPGDVEGLMKLATIQAEDLHDLPAAIATLNALLMNPDLPSNNAVAALQTLADWHLNLGRDTAAARGCFERIVEMFPNSSFSHTAQQRLAHLDGVSEARDLREHTVFKVPTGPRDFGLRQPVSPDVAPEIEADTLAAEYVGQLEKHPNDTETREKLALLYASSLDRLDLAVGQLEQLAALPNETPQHIARWLDLVATLHIRHGHDIEAAEAALRRIQERFPKSAAAERATARLATLPSELKGAATTAAAKPLGVYEKNLGLKAGSR